MPTVPGAISLANIADNAAIIAADHRNNYAAIQTAVNGLIGDLNVGSGGQFLTGNGATLTWASAPASTLAVISDDLKGSDSASFDFTTIAGTYKALFARGILRGTQAAGTVTALVQFNGDSGASYDYELITGTGTGTPSSTATGAATSISSGTIPAANARANRPGFYELLIPFYAETTFEKVASAKSSSVDPGVNNILVRVEGAWRNTVAITRVTVTPSAGSWKTGSHLTLYGIS